MPSCDVDTKGFIDFAPGAAAAKGCDFAGTVGDLGCAGATPQACPRVDVNHGDIDFGVLPPAPLVADLTVEAVPAGIGIPARTIIRWKNAMSFGSAAGSTNHRSMTIELWDDSRIVIVRQRAATTVTVALHDQIGVGPGLAGQGFGGPPPAAPTCGVAAGTPFATAWGTPGILGAPGGVIHMDLLASSIAFSNLAAVFTPAPGIPATYTLTVY
jgi:hypothetical protein